MKILYINALYDPYIAGGAEISLKLIVEGMQARGHEVVVLSMAPEPGMRVDWLNGVKVYRAGLRNGYWPFTNDRPLKLRRLLWHLRDAYNSAMGRYVREVLQQEKPSVVSCHNLVGWSIAAWDEIHRARIPVVQVLHDMYLLSPDSTLFNEGGRSLFQELMRRLLRRRHIRKSHTVGAVVGISRSVLERFTVQGYFRDVPQYVVHNARVIPDVGKPHLREEGQSLKVGYIGTLSVAKGVAWLIRQFKASGIEGDLRIAGGGKEEDLAYFRQLAGDDKRICFVGYVNSGNFYATIDVLVVPSIWAEPLGMVAVEGLANNLPVIASNRGGLRETVAEGINGMLCDPDRPDSLGEALVTLWRDVTRYNRLAAGARSSVSEYLSVERMVTEYEHVLQTLTTDHADA